MKTDLRNIYIFIIISITSFSGCFNEANNVDHFLLANQKYDAGYFNEAIELYSKVIEKNPDFQTAYFYRASSKYAIKDYFGAMEDYTSVIEID